MVRIEAGLIFAGYEFSDQTDPFEAGIGFTVPLKSKNDDFIGREALIAAASEHPQRKLVGLEIEGNEAVGHGDCVHIGRAQVGVVTSATRSPILKKTIALARVDVTHAESAPRSRSASSTASRSGCRRASCASRITIRRRRACAPEAGKLAHAYSAAACPLTARKVFIDIVHRLEPRRMMHRRHGSRAGRFERLVAVADDRIPPCRAPIP